MIRPANTAPARALEGARREILQHLARRGPAPMAELPSTWPMTRHLTRLVVRDLRRDGLLASARRIEDRAPVLVLTETGRRVMGAAEDS